MPLSLKDALTRLTVPDLKDLASHLPGEKPTRKDDLVNHIAAHLLGADLQAIWSGLDGTQRLAVAECVHHPCGVYSAERFRAKYGSEPAFSVKGAKPHGYSGDRRSALGLFIHYAHEDRCSFVPSDLRSRLRGFVPAPPPIALADSEKPDEPGEHILRLGEREALQEVVVMLRAIEQTRIQVSEKTALPSAAGLQALTGKLVGGDFYPWVEKKHKWDQEIGPIRAFAWPMLLQAGGLATRTGNRLTLTPAGIKALGAPPADVLRGLWRKWLKTTLLDEFSRVDTIKGQGGKGRVMTAVAGRREAIDEALRECQVGRWVAVDEFSRFMRATDLVFEVTHDPWTLYVCSRDYGSLGYDGYGGWNILQDRYIFALLMEYAATLGIVDVAFGDPESARADFRGMWGTDDLRFLSRYDGLHAFRLTPLGAYVLGLAPDYRPKAIASTAVLAILPSLRINVTRGELGPEESLLLENWAVLVQPGSWQLDRARSLAAIEKGHDIGELQRFLESQDDMPLPEMVEAFIRKCAHDGKALKLRGSASLIECRDPQTAAAIAGHKETSSLCLAAGPKMLVVRSEHLDKFRERVRLLGFGMPI
jgi:hypothetical protein